MREQSEQSWGSEDQAIAITGTVLSSSWAGMEGKVQAPHLCDSQVSWSGAWVFDNMVVQGIPDKLLLVS